MIRILQNRNVSIRTFRFTYIVLPGSINLFDYGRIVTVFLIG